MIEKHENRVFADPIHRIQLTIGNINADTVGFEVRDVIATKMNIFRNSSMLKEPVMATLINDGLVLDD